MSKMTYEELHNPHSNFFQQFHGDAATISKRLQKYGTESLTVLLYVQSLGESSYGMRYSQFASLNMHVEYQVSLL